MATLGVVLVIVAAALVVAEAHVPTHGVLGTGAAVALTAGIVLALSASGASVGAVIAAGIVVALAGLALAWLLFVKSLEILRLTVRSGRPALVGQVATVRAVPAPIGQVQLGGALWRAQMWDLEDGSAPVAEGSAVVVESIDGLTLTVRPAEEWEVH
jgi:membrane-bound serine protease (ClpP class)